MDCKNILSENKVYNIIFYSIIVCYSFILVYKAEFGIIDDHLFLDSLFKGKMMDLFISPKIGRFYPLDAFEYNLLGQISVNATLFYIYNMIQFIVFVYLSIKTLILLFGNKNLKYYFLLCLFIIFFPSFIESWFRLFVPERNVLFFSTIFLYSFLRADSRNKIFFILLGLFSVNIALYSKEPVFILIGSFITIYTFFNFNNLSKFKKTFIALTFLSILIWCLVYYAMVLSNIGDDLYGSKGFDKVFIRQFLNRISNNPILTIVFVPLSLFRAYKLIFNKDTNHVFYDSLLISSTLYFMVFIYLNMYASHYLLPCYLFSYIGTWHFFVREKYFSCFYPKIILYTSIFLFISGSFLYGLSNMFYLKNTNYNFQNTINFLVNHINSQDKKVNIYLYGIEPIYGGMESIDSYYKYLNSNKLHNSFDLRINESNRNPDFKSDSSVSNYISAFKIGDSIPSKKLDLIVVGSYSRKSKKMNKVKELVGDFKIIYQAKSPFFELKNYGLREITKVFINKYFKNFGNRIRLPSNDAKYPHDFYVLQKE